MYKTVRNSIFSALAVCVAGLFSSCVSPTEVVYLQDVSTSAGSQLEQNYQTVIQKDDQLYISVSSKQPELVAPFLQTELGRAGNTYNSNSKVPVGYLVNENGDIVLPIIGKMKAAGKSCTQLASDIATALRAGEYISDASVNVQITNFKFSVLGEVKAPGTYTTEGQRITVLEALSRAGDLTIDGDRDITLIREVNGQREIAVLDLRSKNIFESPYYYVQQNDVLLVKPSDRKINTRSDAAQWYGWGLSGASIIVAIIALCSV